MAAPEVDPTGFKRVPGQRVVPIGRDADGNPSEFLVGSGPALTDAELRAVPVPVQLVSEPTIEIGKVDQGTPGTSPWLFSETAVLSTDNSSIAPLNNGIAFTGAAELTLVYEGATVAVFADQPGALQVQQSPNGTDWDINELFNVPASGFSTPINFRGAFFRVVFTNNSGSNQTAFRLQTVKRPILNAMQAPAAHGVTLQNGVSGLAVGSNLGTSKYATALVQLTITGTATVTFQASNDGGVTWTAINAHSLGTDVIATTATASGLYRINCVGLMLVRANVTARVSGTITAVGYVSVLPPAFSSMDANGVAQYNASNQTFADGARALAQATVNGFLRTDAGTLMAGEDLTLNRQLAAGKWNYTPITTQTTTLIKTGAGILGAIIVNKPLANGTIAIDDALTATTPTIGTITFPATLLGGESQPRWYNVAFSTGLTIVTGGATQDVTIAWL